MACIESGELTAAARNLLGVLLEPATAEEAARKAGLPLYRVRSALREMVEAQLAEERDSSYAVTAAGKAMLEHRG